MALKREFKLLIHQFLYLVVAPLLMAILLPRFGKRMSMQLLLIAVLILIVATATWIWELRPLGGQPALGNSWLGYGIMEVVPFLLVGLTWFPLAFWCGDWDTRARRVAGGLAILFAYGLGVILGLSVALTFGLASP